MSEALQGYQPRQFTIESLEGKKIDITNSILSIDYFEDILSPSVYMMVTCINKYSIRKRRRNEKDRFIRYGRDSNPAEGQTRTADGKQSACTAKFRF